MGITFHHSNLITLLLVLTALTNLILGSLVMVDSPRRKINRLFSILCLSFSLWSLSYLGLSLVDTPASSLLWQKLYFACFLVFPPVFYNLVLGSLGGAPSKDQGSPTPYFAHHLKKLAYLVGAVLLALTASDVFQSYSKPVLSMAVFYSLINGYGLCVLFHRATQSNDPTQKSRLYYTLVAAVSVGLALGLNLFLVSSWVSLIGPVSCTLSMILIAYAMTTNQLYHFSELFRKTLASLIMTLLLCVAFWMAHLFSRETLTPYFPNSDYFALGIASIVMALLFHPLRYRVQNMVDKLFFTRRYDQMKRIRDLSKRVLSSADRDELMTILFSSLKNVGFGSICVLLKDPQKPIFHIKKGMGLSPQAEGFFLRSDSLLIQYLKEEKQELIKEEVTRRIMADWERQALRDEMDILNAEICFPLFSTRRRSLFGVIVIGRSELGYTSYKGRNIFWLNAVIENAGIMLDNFYHHEFANALIPYVGRTWADEMRRNKEGFRERLSGHRTWVTVLMVDIRHFTPMSSRLDPRDVVSLLKDFRSRVAPIVYRYQGTIDKFIGDAIMIVFGLPILPALPNPDKNAVECAVDIQKEIREMNEERYQAQGKGPISIGIGVSSGEVIAGNVDSGDRTEYTVIGDAANMVARLEDLAGDNQTLISPATYGKVKDLVHAKAWAPRKITGFNDPVTVYELIGMLENTSAGPSPDRWAANQ